MASKREKILYSSYRSGGDNPLGRIYVGESTGGILRLGLSLTREAFLEDLRARYGVEAVEARRLTPLMVLLFDSLDEYLKVRAVGDVPGEGLTNLPLDLRGSGFQLKVWEVLRSIPFGEVLTYGEVAERVGSPGGARAVGTACGKNPTPILVPCHRVVPCHRGVPRYGVVNRKGSMDRKGTEMDIGNYTGGVHIKSALLRLEGVI